MPPFGRAAAEATAEFVTASFRFEVVPGVGHFLTDEAPGVVSDLLIAHLRGSQ